jgi:hypothetical protein
MSCTLATGLYAGGMQNWALGLLSAIYNARYAVAYRKSNTDRHRTPSVAMQ